MNDVQNAQDLKSVKDMSAPEFTALVKSLTDDQVLGVLSFLRGYAPEKLDAALEGRIPAPVVCRCCAGPQPGRPPAMPDLPRPCRNPRKPQPRSLIMARDKEDR